MALKTSLTNTTPNSLKQVHSDNYFPFLNLWSFQFVWTGTEVLKERLTAQYLDGRAEERQGSSF
jgi:hypothetical protein